MTDAPVLCPQCGGDRVRYVRDVMCTMSYVVSDISDDSTEHKVYGLLASTESVDDVASAEFVTMFCTICDYEFKPEGEHDYEWV